MGGGGDDDFTRALNDLDLSASFDLYDADSAEISSITIFLARTLTRLTVLALHGRAQNRRWRPTSGGPCRCLLHRAEASSHWSLIVSGDTRNRPSLPASMKGL